MKDEMLVPFRPRNVKEIECDIVGTTEIDVNGIKHLKNIRAGKEVTTQIVMEAGHSYYIRGKDIHQAADELGIVLGPPQ